MRPTLDEVFMNIAILFSKRGTCPRGRVGAVITLDNRVISTGYAGSGPGQPHCDEVGCLIEEEFATGCQRTTHAEINAIMFAAKHGVALKGGTVYVTLKPCLSCAKAMSHAGIKEVFYLEDYRDPRGVEYLEGCGIRVTQYRAKILSFDYETTGIKPYYSV